ncbi:MAG: HYExAFE family protein [Pirellulaceae bacterium]
MANRRNHYEAAFEAYLRWLAAPYIAVDETHRSLAGERSLKSLDFIVSPRTAGGGWLVDVKGRRFPTGASYWKNWSTADELTSLAAWEALFGPRFTGLLVFAYNVVGERAPLPADELFVFRDSLYGFVAIRLDHYASWSKQLSLRWGTVSVPTAQFRSLARPVREVLGLAHPHSAGAA